MGAASFGEAWVVGEVAGVDIPLETCMDNWGLYNVRMLCYYRGREIVDGMICILSHLLGCNLQVFFFYHPQYSSLEYISLRSFN